MIGPSKMALTSVEERDDESRFENTSIKMLSTAGKGSAMKFSPTSDVKRGGQHAMNLNIAFGGHSNEQLLRRLENSAIPTATLKMPLPPHQTTTTAASKVSDETTSADKQSQKLSSNNQGNGRRLKPCEEIILDFGKYAEEEQQTE